MSEEKLTDESVVWILTIEYCGNGRRGILLSRSGGIDIKPEQHTEDEIADHLGMFWLILAPKSIQMKVSEIKKYNRFIPLAEYSHIWGIGLTAEQVEAHFQGLNQEEMLQ